MISQNPKYFITIAQSESLTQASEKLYVSQPSLSQYLKRLEQSLDAELVDRSTKPLTLTSAGERYYEYVTEAQRLERNMREELLDLRREVSGTLRLGIAVWRGSCLLPEVYPEFHRRFPKVKLELLEGRFSRLRQALLSNEIDLAIANLLPAGQFSELKVEPLIRERLLLAAPAGHPAVGEALERAAPGKVPTADLSLLEALPLILTKEGQSLTEMVKSILTRNHVRPEILLETGNLTTAIHLVAAGMGCAFVPAEGAGSCQQPDRVSFFALDLPGLDWELAFLTRPDSYMSNIKRSFMQCTRDILSANGRIALL